MVGFEIVSYALVLSSEFCLRSLKTLNTSLMCLGYLIVLHSPPCHLASLISLCRFLCLCIYFVEFSDKMKAVVPLPCFVYRSYAECSFASRQWTQLVGKNTPGLLPCSGKTVGGER